MLRMPFCYVRSAEMHQLVEAYETGIITRMELIIRLIQGGPTEDLPADVLAEIKQQAQKPERLKVFRSNATSTVGLA
jgi:hypothetical protein